MSRGFLAWQDPSAGAPSLRTSCPTPVASRILLPGSLASGLRLEPSPVFTKERVCAKPLMMQQLPQLQEPSVPCLEAAFVPFHPVSSQPAP